MVRSSLDGNYHRGGCSVCGRIQLCIGLIINKLVESTQCIHNYGYGIILPFTLAQTVKKAYRIPSEHRRKP